ncbi:hypothetical protein ABZS63_38820, partial [Streptomyces sp. NPDC005568]
MTAVRATTMARASAVTAAACAAVLATALPSSAINSYNATPAPERTEVGALVATWDNDDDPATPDRVDWVCSGTMIDSGTFLTAAHCTTDWALLVPRRREGQLSLVVVAPQRVQHGRSGVIH